MDHYSVAEQNVEKAFMSVRCGRYDMGVKLYYDALSRFDLFMKSVSKDEQPRYEPVQRAIAQELQYAIYIYSGFKAATRPSISVEYENDDDSSEPDANAIRPSPAARQADRRNTYHQKLMNTPSKWKYNVVKPSYQRKTITPARDDHQTPREAGHQQYSKPWQQNQKEKKAPRGDGLPEKYEGVDPYYIPMIHNLMLKNTGVSFSDIAGLEVAKKMLMEAIVWPIKTPELFNGVSPTKGCLLFGPPGTGKTKIVKAIATEAGCTFFAPTSATIMNKMVGDSEKVVQALFNIARYHAPSIVFIDEIDALLSAGSQNENDVSKRIRQEFLTQMEGVTTGAFDIKTHILVIGATNHPDRLDEALRRRLQKRVHIPMPELQSRLEMLKLFTGGQKLGDDVDFQRLAERLDGYNGSDIFNICQDAKMECRRKLFEYYDLEELQRRQQELAANLTVTLSDFEKAIQKTKPSVCKADILKIEEFERQFAAE